MKQTVFKLAVLSLLATSTPALADISCIDSIHSLVVKYKPDDAVSVSLGIGRGAIQFEGTQLSTDSIQVLSESIYLLESQYKQPAVLKVVAKYPTLLTFGCGRRICIPEHGPVESVPTNPLKIEATLEVGGDNKSVYHFKNCSKFEG